MNIFWPRSGNSPKRFDSSQQRLDGSFRKGKMGCNLSAQVRGSPTENRTEELGKCAAFSSEVRWSWLRGHTLFTFGELRNLLKLYQGAISEPLDSPSGKTAPVSSAGDSLLVSGGGGILGKRQDGCTGAMSKNQFLIVCESDEALRLSVGAFGSRLFDILDEDGDGRLDFEDFAVGLSKLLKGQESEKLKLMYAAYDLSGVVPSEERSKWVGGGKAFRRSKYLTVENITTVLASATLHGAYPVLLGFTGGRSDAYWSGAGCAETSNDGVRGTPKGNGVRRESGGAGGVPRQGSKGARAAGSAGGCCRSSEALTELLQELARRNAASFAERAVSEFGKVKDGALTPKEFERWALTSPVLRCRMNEFSIDVDVAPFQGVRLDC